MKYLVTLIKEMQLRDTLFFSGYALYLAFSYMALHSATVLSSGGGLDFDTQTLFLIAVISARVVAFMAIALIARYTKTNLVKILPALAGATAVAGFLVLGMSLQFASRLPADMLRSWLMLGGVLLGFGDVAITLLWARFSATLTLRSVYLYVVLCNGVSLVVYFIVTLLPGETGVPVAAALFLLSVIAAKKSLDRRRLQQWEYSSPVFVHALRSVSQPILGTAVLYFMSGLMLQISGQRDIPLAFSQQTALLTSAIVVVCLLLPALLVKKPFNIGRMYAVALPLSAAGFLLLPLVWNAAGGIVNSFAQLGSMVAAIILWCMLAGMSRDTELPSALLFSIAFASINAALLAGTLVGFLYSETLRQSDIVLTAVTLVAAYLLFMAALFLFKDKSLKNIGSEAELPAIRPEAHVPQQCERIADSHQFTPRERDIFALLAQGFTIPAISEKLFVSENTVKSHVKSIYQKMGIHTRSELIEQVNAQ